MNDSIFEFLAGFRVFVQAFIFAQPERFNFFDTVVSRTGNSYLIQLFGNKHRLIFIAVIPGLKQIANH